MKKKKRLASFIVAFVLLLTGSMTVLAEEETVLPTEETQVTDVGEYLNAETPEKIVECFQLQELEDYLFQGAGKAYEGNGIRLEWLPDNGSVYNGMTAISFNVSDNRTVSYKGIGCGSTKKEVDRVMKEDGWVPWGYDSQHAFYLKWANDRWYAFSMWMRDEIGYSWEWLNWMQGNLGKLPYDDVAEGDWYFDAVKYVHSNWLMTGMKNRAFGPAEDLARAQFAVILHRMNEEPSVEYTKRFPDVEEGIWYTDAILWAESTGVVQGYTDTGLFGPADLINREQMAVMMYRYAQYKGYDTGQKADFGKFADASKVSDFAQDAMQWAVGSGIITGKENGTRIDPQGNANRAECATIIMRFVEKYGK